MEERDVLERDIDKRQQENLALLEEQFFILGSKLYKYTKENNLPVGRKMYEECLALESRRNEIDEKFRNLSAFSFQYNENTERREKLCSECEELSGSIRNYKIRLGAILYERVSMSLVGRDDFPFVFEDFEKESELKKRGESRNPIEKLASQTGLQRFQKSANERYISYIDKTIELGLLDKIGGNNAPLITSELEPALLSLEGKNKEIDDIDTFEKENEESVAALSKDGVAGLKAMLGDANQNFKTSLKSYGSYLFDKGAIWISETTPSEILDSIEDILSLQGECAKIDREREKIARDDKISQFQALIKSDEDKILILTRERDKIDQEIDNIQQEIDRMKAIIERML